MAPNDELYELNVGNILGGKFPDIFARAFQQLIANMRDPNTPAEAVRKVTFEFTIEPNSDRSVGDITLKTPLKLAGIESITGTLYVSLQAMLRDSKKSRNGTCGWVEKDGSRCIEPSPRNGLYCKKHKAECMRDWRAREKRRLARMAMRRRFCREPLRRVDAHG